MTKARRKLTDREIFLKMLDKAGFTPDKIQAEADGGTTVWLEAYSGAVTGYHGAGAVFTFDKDGGLVGIDIAES